MGSLASSYTNFDDLLAGVVSSVQDILEGVAPEIETRLQASIVENVHSKSGRSDGIESKRMLQDRRNRGVKHHSEKEIMQP